MLSGVHMWVFWGSVGCGGWPGGVRSSAAAHPRELKGAGEVGAGVVQEERGPQRRLQPHPQRRAGRHDRRARVLQGGGWAGEARVSCAAQSCRRRRRKWLLTAAMMPLCPNRSCPTPSSWLAPPTPSLHPITHASGRFQPPPSISRLALSSTASTPGAMSSTFILTDTARLYSTTATTQRRLCPQKGGEARR